MNFLTAPTVIRIIMIITVYIMTIIMITMIHRYDSDNNDFDNNNNIVISTIIDVHFTVPIIKNKRKE
jgi:hypothetical protein